MVFLWKVLGAVIFPLEGGYQPRGRKKFPYQTLKYMIPRVMTAFKESGAFLEGVGCRYFSFRGWLSAEGEE